MEVFFEFLYYNKEDRVSRFLQSARLKLKNKLDILDVDKDMLVVAKLKGTDGKQDHAVAIVNG